MNGPEPETVKRLYQQEQLNAKQIAITLGCGIHTVYKLMGKHGIPRRTSSASRKIAFDASAPSFTPAAPLSDNLERLKAAALMLYWAEGSKRAFGTVDFSNCDPEMIALFLKCLRTVYGISEQRLRVLLYCYADQAVEHLIDFWSNVTRIPPAQFSKPYVRACSSKDHHVMPYGLVHIRYSDQRLFTLIQRDTRTLIEDMLGW